MGGPIDQIPFFLFSLLPLFLVSDMEEGQMRTTASDAPYPFLFLSQASLLFR